MSQLWVLMSDVYCLDNDGEPFVTLKRGDWFYQEGFCGQLGFRDPSDVHFFKGTDTSQEGFMVAEGGRDSGSWGYVAVPHSCLSDNYYDSHDNLWIVADPKATGKNVTLMQVAEDAQGERVEVPLSKLAKDLGTTVKKLRSYLQGLVVSREGDDWFNSAHDRDRHRKTLSRK